MADAFDPNQIDAVDIRELRDDALWTLNKAKEVLLDQGEVVLPGGSKTGLIVVGFAVGAGLGAVGGYFFARRRLETKYEELMQDELDEMQKHYRAKESALENTVEKRKLASLVSDRGYSDPESVDPPMAVTPPETMVDRADRMEGEPPERPEVDETTEVRSQNVFQQNDPQEADGWDYQTELRRRSPVRPYVIHQDERDEYPDYDTITYTYYEIDDVLCNERDEVFGKPERDVLVGEANLNRFGHGSGDPSIVYIRNDKMEMVMEVVLSPNSYAEEVHGFQHSDIYHRERRSRRSSEDDE